MPEKAWRDPCVKCAKAAYMLCIVCETVDVQKAPVRLKLKEKRLCASSDANSGSSSESA
jgi:hypothetical protein